MDPIIPLAILNDNYKLNSPALVEIFEGKSTEDVELSAFKEYIRGKSLLNDQFNTVGKEAIKTLESASVQKYKDYIHEVRQNGIEVYSLLDEDYPDPLKNIQKPPLVLYVKGDHSVWKKSIGVVGTRSATDKRRAYTEHITRQLVDDDWTVVSGLANGIDELGHRYAIEYSGQTIAVLPGQIGKIYPASNRELGSKIPEHGALISEVSKFVSMGKHRYVQRNRITSALSDAIIVAASKDTGGTIRQAEFASSQGVPILLFDPKFDDGQSPEKIRELGAYTFSNIDELADLLVRAEEGDLKSSVNNTLDQYSNSS